jgi:hypothetical protein
VNKLAIPYDALVFVGDGRKALFLRNDVDEEFSQPENRARTSPAVICQWLSLSNGAIAPLLISQGNSPHCQNQEGGDR